MNQKFLTGFIQKIIKRRTEKLANIFDNFITPGEKILDIGAGGGWLGKEIQKRKNANMTLLDVANFNQTDLKLHLYDGKKIPFPDKSFDTSFLIFTLHHCRYPLEILKEAKRVAKKKIIVVEDAPLFWLDKFFHCVSDTIFNLPSLIKMPGENMPFNFKGVREWKRIFSNLKLKTVFQKKFSSLRLISHVLFVIQK